MLWYCLQAKPRREQNLALHLQQRYDLEAFCPMLRRKRKIRNKRRVVQEALFPRYLFCRFDLAQHFRAARYAPDAIGLVSRGDMPISVPDEVIADLRSWAGPDAAPLEADPGLRPGDTVTVSEGPFQGLEATVLQSLDKNERVALLLTFMNTVTRLHIDRAQLEPLPR